MKVAININEKSRTNRSARSARPARSSWTSTRPDWCSPRRALADQFRRRPRPSGRQSRARPPAQEDAHARRAGPRPRPRRRRSPGTATTASPSTDRGDDDRRNDQPSRRDDRPSSRNYGRDYRNDDRRSDRDDDRPPSTGKQLFGWAKDRDALRWFSDFAATPLPRQIQRLDPRRGRRRDAWYTSRSNRAPVNGNGRR